ncbi:hypothetical protein SAMN06297382_2604 [Amphiplicatus metriothermophilus]|uniref:Uncharacterized protein n=1 Tax=Amphiplicatus metriothermophilus TaxID=1519374 RepID=A0A239PY00_9PROT|nr:hypothetical protein [Amphiplicatus metriothermophilus]SNT75191.1 hypothetical protein SAMN06297382_2604 [Amphiplicatus metriothermophilus]
MRGYNDGSGGRADVTVSYPPPLFAIHYFTTHVSEVNHDC